MCILLRFLDWVGVGESFMADDLMVDVKMAKSRLNDDGDEVLDRDDGGRIQYEPATIAQLYNQTIRRIGELVDFSTPH